MQVALKILQGATPFFDKHLQSKGSRIAIAPILFINDDSVAATANKHSRNCISVNCLPAKILPANADKPAFLSP